jgi:glycosyltransferase involved in cell wall biosynthesis
MSRQVGSIPSIAQRRSAPVPSRRRHGDSRSASAAAKKMDDESPLVTIITPVRNAASTLGRTICSVLGQSYPNIEYIVVDGDSTDGTLDILHSFEHGIDYWHSEPDAGISDAFNKGIALATGDIIGILNADDWYEPDTVAVVVEAFSAGEADVVCGALQYWQGDRRGLVFYSDPENLPLESTVNHPTVFVKREVYLRHGLYCTQYKYAMDYDLLLRFYLGGVRFHVLTTVLANMQLGGASDSVVLPISRELFAIKTWHLGRPARQALYSGYHFVRTHLSKSIREVGADQLLDAYRHRHSVVKKDRPIREG